MELKIRIYAAWLQTGVAAEQHANGKSKGGSISGRIKYLPNSGLRMPIPPAISAAVTLCVRLVELLNHCSAKRFNSPANFFIAPAGVT